MDKDRIVIGPGIDPIVETAVNITIEEQEVIIITIEITGPTTEVEIGQEMDMEIGEIIARIIGEIIMDRIMVTKGIETEVQVRTMVDLGKDTEATHGTGPILEIDRVTIVETKAEVDKGLILMTGKVIGQGLDQVHM